MNGVIIRGGPEAYQVEIIDAESGKRLDWVTEWELRVNSSGELVAILTADVAQVDVKTMLTDLKIKPECPLCSNGTW